MAINDDLQRDDLSQPKTPFAYLRLFLSGFAMGSADIVPGVSGGTMAFILGIYETLINAIKSFDLNVIRLALKFDVKGVLEHVPIRFLIALGAGVGTAILLLASLLHTFLEEQPTFLFAFFAGLIVASILAIGVKVKWNVGAMVSFFLAALFAFFIVGFEAEEHNNVIDLVHAVENGEPSAELRNALITQLNTVEFEDAEAQVDFLINAVQAGEPYSELEETLEDAIAADYTPSNPLVLFGSGMIAICAMILPGISGSFILLILGQYEAVLGAVKNLDVVSVAAVGAGAAIGIILFSRVISWLLNNYENITVAGLVGFMAGSLRLIWSEAAKGVDVVSQTGTLAGEQIVFVVGLTLVGFLLVSFLDHLQSRTNPVFAPFWRPAPAVDTLSEKASALE